MTVSRIFPSGGWSISAIVDGYLVTRRYFGMTKREAVAAFKSEFAS